MHCPCQWLELYNNIEPGASHYFSSFLLQYNGVKTLFLIFFHFASIAYLDSGVLMGLILMQLVIFWPIVFHAVIASHILF